MSGRRGMTRRAALGALAAAAVGGCGKGGSGGSTGGPSGKTFAGAFPIKVVCTTGMVGDLARAVGKDRCAVTALLGDGVDPHLYKPAPGDVSALNGADAIFYSGLGLEGKMADLFVRLARDKPTHPVTETIPPDKLLDDPELGHDPHVWHDVSLWAHGADAVAAALAAFDPPHAEEYKNAAAAHRAELDALHADIKKQLAAIPKERRVLVTAHDAFRYFGRAYDIEVRAVQGVSTEAEAGVKEVNDLVAFIVERKVRAVFVENIVPEKQVRAVIDGCKARGHAVALGGELHSDALGKAGSPGATYVGMVRHNVATVADALK